MKHGRKMRKQPKAKVKGKGTPAKPLHVDQGKTYANIIGEVARATKKSYKP